MLCNIMTELGNVFRMSECYKITTFVPKIWNSQPELKNTTGYVLFEQVGIIPGKGPVSQMLSFACEDNQSSEYLF